MGWGKISSCMELYTALFQEVVLYVVKGNVGVPDNRVPSAASTIREVTRTSAIQGDQLNMAVCFWYLVKGELCSVHVFSSVH